MSIIMPSQKKEAFSSTLKRFQLEGAKLKTENKKRLVLIIMSNTHDATLSVGCVKDAASVSNSFKEICKQTGYHFCSIEISGKNYSSKNLFKTLSAVEYFNDVTVFYYSGHGFSYQNDSKYKYPQLDMRSYNNHADHNKIDFIEQHTVNLKSLLLMMMFKAGRINIAIADCCNTTIPFKRKKASISDMEVTEDVMITVSKKFTKALYADEENMVSVLVSSSTQGQPAVADNDIGSIFTHHFTSTISNLLTKEVKHKQYFPWVSVLKKTAYKAFKESRKYDIGNGIAGKQKAVFEVFIEGNSDFDKRMAKNDW